jgi:hypothetical protein
VVRKILPSEAEAGWQPAQGELSPSLATARSSPWWTTTHGHFRWKKIKTDIFILIQLNEKNISLRYYFSGWSNDKLMIQL